MSILNFTLAGFETRDRFTKLEIFFHFYFQTDQNGGGEIFKIPSQKMRTRDAVITEYTVLSHIRRIKSNGNTSGNGILNERETVKLMYRKKYKTIKATDSSVQRDYRDKMQYEWFRNVSQRTCFSSQTIQICRPVELSIPIKLLIKKLIFYSYPKGLVSS